MPQQKYSDKKILEKVEAMCDIWLAYFDIFVTRSAILSDDYERVADSFISEKAEKRNLPELLNSIPDETILLALKRERAKDKI